ncbi:unnamed protein product, partial [Tuber aestivum]
MSSASQLPPPSYSPFPGETERTLSPDDTPPVPPYSPPSSEIANYPFHQMSAEQVVTWLNAKGVFSPLDYPSIFGIPLWYKMVERRLDGGSVLKFGLVHSFWEEMVGTLEAQRIVSLIARSLTNAGKPKSRYSPMENYKRHLCNYYRLKHGVSKDAKVPESALRSLRQDLPPWDVLPRTASQISPKIWHSRWPEPNASA